MNALDNEDLTIKEYFEGEARLLSEQIRLNNQLPMVDDLLLDSFADLQSELSTVQSLYEEIASLVDPSTLIAQLGDEKWETFLSMLKVCLEERKYCDWWPLFAPNAAQNLVTYLE